MAGAYLGLRHLHPSRIKTSGGLSSTAVEERYARDHDVFSLGARYRVSDFVTFSGRVDNRLNAGSPSDQYAFVDNGNGTVWLCTQDADNIKDKAGSFWVSVYVRF